MGRPTLPPPDRDEFIAASEWMTVTDAVKHFRMHSDRVRRFASEWGVTFVTREERNAKYHFEHQQQVVELARAGVSLHQTANRVGVNPQKLINYRRRQDFWPVFDEESSAYKEIDKFLATGAPFTHEDLSWDLDYRVSNRALTDYLHRGFVRVSGKKKTMSVTQSNMVNVYARG